MGGRAADDGAEADNSVELLQSAQFVRHHRDLERAGNFVNTNIIAGAAVAHQAVRGAFNQF